MEVQLTVHDPQRPEVSRIRVADLDREPKQDIVDAAQAAVDLIAHWDDDRYARIFAEQFRERHPVAEFRAWIETIAEPGPCIIEQPDRTGPHSTLFVLACGELRRTLVVSLDSRARISRFGVHRLLSDPDDRPAYRSEGERGMD